MNSTNRPSPELFLDDHRGIYIPRDFAESIDPRYWFGISTEDLETLSDPDNDLYWETWDDVTCYAVAFLPDDGDFDTETMSALERAREYDKAGDPAKRDEILDTLPGRRWTLYQDGALFLVPDGMEWSDSEEWYVWPEEHAA